MKKIEKVRSKPAKNVLSVNEKGEQICLGKSYKEYMNYTYGPHRALRMLQYKV